MDSRVEFQQRFESVSAAIAAACVKAGRSTDEIRVIGVTKTVEPDAMEPLLRAGVREFGENRWQHAKTLLESPLAAQATWHFIGHLQTNKAKYIVPRFAYVHSIDSLELIEELERQGQRFEQQVRGLIQVNVSGEESKFGATPSETAKLVQAAETCQHVHVVGLMTMAPQGASETETKSVFRGLADLRAELRQRFTQSSLTELSMGMSDDFEWAIEEGATMVRIGRRLVGTPTP